MMSKRILVFVIRQRTTAHPDPAQHRHFLLSSRQVAKRNLQQERASGPSTAMLSVALELITAPRHACLFHLRLLCATDDACTIPRAGDHLRMPDFDVARPTPRRACRITKGRPRGLERALGRARRRTCRATSSRDKVLDVWCVGSSAFLVLGTMLLLLTDELCGVVDRRVGGRLERLPAGGHRVPDLGLVMTITSYPARATSASLRGYFVELTGSATRGSSWPSIAP